MKKKHLRCKLGLHKWVQEEVCNTTVVSTDGSYTIVVFIHYKCDACGKKRVTTTFESEACRKYWEGKDK